MMSVRILAAWQQNDKNYAQIEPGCVWDWIRWKSLVERHVHQVGSEVEPVTKALDNNFTSEVPAVMREVTMVYQGVHHRAWAADCVSQRNAGTDGLCCLTISGPSWVPGLCDIHGLVRVRWAGIAA